jgi:hypothetical protein
MDRSTLLFFAQTNLGWEELARQVPLLAVALGVAWYAFKHIAKQQDEHLKDIRTNTDLTIKMLGDAHSRTEAAKDTQTAQTIKMLSDAHTRTEAAKDAQIKELQIALQSERSEKERLLKVIDNIGAKA